MKVRWLDSALKDLYAVYEFVAADNPVAARSMLVRIRQTIMRLESSPESGRLGRLPGTRELAIPNLPLFVVYRVRPAGVEVLCVIHSMLAPTSI